MREEQEPTYLILERQELLVVGDLVGVRPRQLRLLRDTTHRSVGPGRNLLAPGAV